MPLRQPTRRRRSLDVDCKAHELDNLYVVDTSFFPSIGAVESGADRDGELAPGRRPPPRTPRHRSRGMTRAESRRLPRRFRRSPTTRSSRTVTPARSLRPTAPSIGSACPRSTRRASSGACSTARRLFRLGPFGINRPSARGYEPGTNVLVTTWKTPGGWLVVRDALTMGPREREDR